MLSLLSLTPHSPHILSRGLAFPTTANLQSHVLTHSTKRPHGCTEVGCNKRFKTPCAFLKQHALS